METRWVVGLAALGCAAGLFYDSPQERFRAALVGAVVPVILYLLAQLLWMMVPRLLAVVRQRNMLQFSLRGLLTFMVLCAVWLATWANSLRPIYEQQRLAAVVKQLGGVSSVVDTEEMRISLGGPQITDDVLAYLATMPAARTVTALSVSRSATMGPSSITDAGMVHLTKFPNLRDVAITNSRISDKGFDTLRRVRSLKAIHMFGCPNITDQGVAWLAERRDLRMLNLMNTGVTLKKMEELNDALPNCRVIRNLP